MSTIEQKLNNAVAALEIPGVVVASQNKTGSFDYAKAFGALSFKEAEDAKVMPLDATFWLASCTKLLSAIAALQCVERGQFTLDEDVTRILPELKEIAILTGFEEDTDAPTYTKSTKTITLRHLLTHTSGLAYDVFNPSLQRWRHSRGEEASLSKGALVHRCLTPLVSVPGESFEYGTGLDWASIMISRTNSISFESYLQKYIFAPMNVTNISFHLENRPDMLARLPDMSVRLGGANPLTGTAAMPTARVAADKSDSLWPATGIKDDSGGAGGFGSAGDYLKILLSLVSDDYKLLGSEMIAELFRPQLGEAAQKALEKALETKEGRDIMSPGIPAATKVGYGLGGLLVLEDLNGRRKKGSLSWSGLPSMFWWVDRVSGVCGIYGSQVVPMGDAKSVEMFVEFEKEMYERVKETGS